MFLHVQNRKVSKEIKLFPLIKIFRGRSESELLRLNKYLPNDGESLYSSGQAYEELKILRKQKDFERDWN